MEVFVCIGSSCHLKGSYDIITTFQQMVKDHQLEEKVNLAAAFCLGRCTDGVTIKVEDEIICGLNKDNAKEMFEQHILSKLA